MRVGDLNILLLHTGFPYLKRERVSTPKLRPRGSRPAAGSNRSTWTLASKNRRFPCFPLSSATCLAIAHDLPEGATACSKTSFNSNGKNAAVTVFSSSPGVTTTFERALRFRLRTRSYCDVVYCIVREVVVGDGRILPHVKVRMDAQEL